MAVPVHYSDMLAACHVPPRGDAVPAFVHKVTGAVLSDRSGGRG
jgi:hypothetical protein